MVNYSKWDNLELSDDSDIEVHPNVDKRSFIRAKQNQIHAERQQRNIQIEALKYERIINDTLSRRLSSLISALKAPNHHSTPNDNTGDRIFRAAMEVAPRDPAMDQPPPRPRDVFTEDQPLPTFSKMIMSLLDGVVKKIGSSDIKPEKRYDATIDELGVHLGKIQTMQTDLATKLSGLEKEDRVKTTSESYRVGFDSSHVSKDVTTPVSTGTKPELLNPGFAVDKLEAGRGDGGSREQTQLTGEKEVKASLEAKEFAQIQPSNFQSSWQYILAHREILRESDTDGLLIEALRVAVEEDDDQKTWRYVHQAMLLQYCRMLGHDGVNIFFKRMTGQDHRAGKLFTVTVKEKFERICELALEQRTAESHTGNQVEQIQIQAIEPGTSIQIRIPDADSDEEEAKLARAIYEEFSPKVKEALKSGTLERVNEVLGEMDVAEAEILVSQLGEAGCLDIQEDVIDATTNEGRKYLEDLEASALEGKTSLGVEDDAPSY